MPTKIELAYVAGVIDSDGCIGIKKSDYAMRVRRDAGQPVYAERVTLKQVQPDAVDLCHSLFGGHRGVTDPSAKRGKPLHTWHIHSRSAGIALRHLLPFLRIKKSQAENALALRAIMGTGRKWAVPAIRTGEPLVTGTQFAQLVGCKQATILQACTKGSIPSVRIDRNRMVPVSFVESYKARLTNGGKAPRSRSVSDEMERLFQRAKELNRVGV